jgi:hypothetical protein
MGILLVNRTVGEGLEMLVRFSIMEHFEGAEALAHAARIAAQGPVVALSEEGLEQI